MKTQKLYFQGDLGLIRVDKLPETARKVTVSDATVLAYGEATGHHHMLKTAQPIASYEVEEEAGKFATYVEIAEALAELEEPAVLTHQEHGPITLEPGVYKIVRQVEYVPGAVPRQVMD